MESPKSPKNKMEAFLRTSARALIKVGEALGIHNLDPEPGKIFVTASTGVVSYRVAMKLLDAGYTDLRLGSSHESDKVEDLKIKGAEIVEFAWDREESYPQALSGVKSVLCTIPYTKDWHLHFQAFIDSCKSAGVKHIVKLSFYNARDLGDDFQDVPLVKQHGECDAMLIDLTNHVEIEPVAGADTEVALTVSHPNISYTILAASHIMANPFKFQGKDLRDKLKPCGYYGASGGCGVNYVSPNDVADVAVRVLMSPCAHYNKEYTLTGPEAVKEQHVAHLLSKYMKKPIMYVDQPLHTFQDTLKTSGDPDWKIEDLIALEKMKRSGREEDLTFISKDIEDICGRKAEKYEEYLRNTELMTPIELGQ